MIDSKKDYRLLQFACVVTAACHIASVLLCIYTFREGDLEHFSLVRLMSFVASHPVLWRSACIAVAASSVSFLFFVLSVREVVDTRWKLLTIFAVCLSLIGVGIDLSAHSSMMVYFSDVSTQAILGSQFSRESLLLEGWTTMNQAITHTFLVANFLYSLAGFLLIAAIVLGKGLPAWVGWVGLPVWMGGLMVSMFTILSAVHWAIVFLFGTVIAYIVWTIVIAVAVDRSEHQAEHSPDN